MAFYEHQSQQIGQQQIPLLQQDTLENPFSDGWKLVEDYLINSKKNKYEQDPISLDYLRNKYRNICVNGKDKNKLQQNDLLDEFVKGPCSPIVILPGIAGTSLQVQIDCEVLKNEEPEIFESCGWKTCNKYNIFQSKPNQEYTIWVGDIFQPGSILEFRKDEKCLGNLIQLRYNSSEQDIHKKWIEPKGLNVTWRGNTPQTKEKSKCGAHAIEDISSSGILDYFDCDLEGYKNLFLLLDSMGYQSGLSYQAIPYDFRKAIRYAPLDQTIKKSLKNLKYYTGKKSIVLTHSYGSLHALYSFNQFKQEEKDDLIKMFINVGAPFLGGSRVVNEYITGDSHLMKFFNFIKKQRIGILFESQVQMIQSSSSLFDLYPTNVYERFQSEPWMQEVLKRIQYEKDPQLFQNEIPLNYFPNKNENCSNEFTKRNLTCQTGLYDMKEMYTVDVQGKRYFNTESSVQLLLKEQTNYGQNPYQIYQEVLQESLLNLTNPNVPTVLVYGGHSDTEISFTYHQNPVEAISKRKFSFPDEYQFSIGDGTVQTTSTITAGIKWHSEYESQKSKDTKPIKFMEMCSVYNQTANIYDSFSDKNGKNFQNQGYNGLNCECLYKKKGGFGSCSHSCMIGDTYFLQFIASTLMDEQKSIRNYEISSQQIKNQAENCENLQ